MTTTGSRKRRRRGLLNLKTTPDALAHMLDEKNVELFTSPRCLHRDGADARAMKSCWKTTCKVVNIEALTMLDMARKDILPAMSSYSAESGKRCGSQDCVARRCRLLL